jgi:hypothetical protein
MSAAAACCLPSPGQAAHTTCLWGASHVEAAVGAQWLPSLRPLQEFQDGQSAGGGANGGGGGSAGGRVPRAVSA